MTSVAVVEPLDLSLIAPADTSIVIDVVDEQGSHPARELNVVRNGLIFTWVAGVTTFLDPDYVVVVTTPTGTTTRFTFTKATPWLDPETVAIGAVYTPDGLNTVEAQVDALSGSLSLVVTDPPAEQPDVSETASVGFTIRSTAIFTTLSMQVNGRTAVSLNTAAPDSASWQHPDFAGTSTVTPSLIAVNAVPRRAFSPEQVVTVEVQFGLASELYEPPIILARTLSYRFYIRPRTTPLFNPALRQGPLDRPFIGRPAIEAYRFVLLGALRTRVSAPGGDVLVYSRVLRSSLGGVAQQFLRPDLNIEVSRLVAEDLADVNTVALVLDQVAVLWDAAVREAREASVDPLLVDLIAQTFDAPYPQEKVGAAAALVFAVGQKIAFTP